ncbi:MAG: tetratricopeptide repeat protein [Deltaproteobacteria bacterium]|nr:tetratricopeptide repeat protein [Deltaproteobacteria bacterium]
MDSTKSYLLFVLLFFLLGLPRPVLFAADPTPQTADEHARYGAALLSEGRWDDAIKSLTTATRINPQHAEATATLGMAYYFKGDLESAISTFQTALRLAPTRIDAAHGLGLALYEKGDLDKTISAFRAAAQLNPISNYNLGNALEQKGDKTGAVEAYKRYLAASPNAPEAALLDEAVKKGVFPTPAGGTVKTHFQRGQDLLAKQDAKGAIIEFLAALRLKPNHAEACNALGSAFRTAGDLEQAIGAYNMALQFDAKFSGALKNLGQALEEQGDVVQAVETYGRYLQLVPNAPDARQIREKMTQLRATRP